MQTVKATLVKITKNPYLIVGLSIIVFYLIVGLLAPILAPPTPGSDPFSIPQDEFLLQTRALGPNKPILPTANHIFGTTYQQLDIYYGCIWGTLTALRLGILATLGAIAIGFIVGFLSGYFGGFVDEALSWVINIFLALSLILAVVLVMSWPIFWSFGPLTIELSKLDRVTIALMFVGWPICANIFSRGISKIRRASYVQAQTAQISKSDKYKTYIALILHTASIQLAASVLFAAAISFLGFGARFNYPDWGNLLSMAQYIISPRHGLLTHWNVYVFPGIFLSTFVLGWILLSEGFQTILEKRTLPALIAHD